MSDEHEEGKAKSARHSVEVFRWTFELDDGRGGMNNSDNEHDGPQQQQGGRRVVRGKIPNPNINFVLLLLLLLLSLLRQQQQQLARYYHRSCSASAFVLLPSSTGCGRAGFATAVTTAKSSSSAATSSLPSGRRAEVVVPTEGEDESMPALLILERVDQKIIDPCSMMMGTNNNNNDNNNNNRALHRDGILESVDREHVRDVGWAEASTLPFESSDGSAALASSSSSRRGGSCWNATEYCESIHVLGEPASAKLAAAALATRTKRGYPLLTGDEIDCLRGASEFYWSRIIEEGGEDDETSSEKSPFTYQRKGNSEAHLSDVVRYCQHQHRHRRSDDAITKKYDAVAPLVNDLLLNRVYPWIREYYLSREGGDIGNELELFVYDSLFIRYNTTAANAPNNDGDDAGYGSRDNVGSGGGAGQPLHRDLGYVSVNIMLNDEFEGGGTFFEDQLLPLVLPPSGVDHDDDSGMMQPLKPLGPGHAIAHYSSSRHAGAATCAGVRDILVIFLAATTTAKGRDRFTDANGRTWNAAPPPRWERNARLKAAARTYCSEFATEDDQTIICRVLHHRLAIDQVMDDGEAWHYLGMALLDYHDHLHGTSSSVPTTDMELKLAVSCLNEATKHTPCDGRLYNNLGIALERLMHCYESNHLIVTELREKAAAAYQTSILIHSTCEKMRCDIRADYTSACLNYGLYLSKLDQFGLAIDILSRVAPRTNICVDAENDLDEMTRAQQRVVRDATNLMSFCKRQLDK